MKDSELEIAGAIISNRDCEENYKVEMETSPISRENIVNNLK